MFDQHVVERWHQVEITDLLTLNRIERFLGVKLRYAYEFAINQRHGEQRAHSHGVIERHHAEAPLPAHEPALRHMGDGSRPLDPVNARHAFGSPRSAGCIEHHGPSVDIAMGCCSNKVAGKQTIKLCARTDAR